MIANSILFYVSSILLLLTLFFSSMEDFRYHRISKKYVLICLIVVMVYNNLIGGSVEATICLILTLGLFSAFTFFSKGGFGFGDTLILASLGWYIGNLLYLQYFFVIIGFAMLILGSYFVVINHKQNHKGWKKIFNNIINVKVSDLKPGMILENDYFMKGLTEKEIIDLQKRTDINIFIRIKQAYPFIPVIFISFLCYVVIYVNYF